MADRVTGTIARLMRDKGFGFIQGDHGGAKCFFHRSAVRRGSFDTLTEGQRVEYTEEAGDKGPRAADVQPVG